ncbi:MAG: tetratricopeptide repeat protein [Proteobacteria bacterium]|nr:tetratricopeptide repeat protein [Pseudomonadota bacterium]
MSKDDATEGFVQEVDQHIREERLLEDFKRYGPWLGGLFLVFLLGIGGWQLWTDHQRQAAREESTAFRAAQEMAQQNNMAGAKAAFLHLTTQGSDTYRVMARMEYAAILQLQGDMEGSIAAFDQAAAAAHDPVLKETAQLRAAYLAADTQDFEAVQRRLQPLLQSHSRISFLARELLGIQAWQSGHYDIARSTLEDLTLAFDAPEGVRQRAQATLALLPAAPAAATSATSTNSSARGATPPAPSQGAHQ